MTTSSSTAPTPQTVGTQRRQRTPRPFRFGVLSGGAPTRAEWVTRARKVEDLGYSTLALADHVGVAMGPIAAMVAAAGATTLLRIGVHVFGNDFRHPVLLAKEMATLDELSGGRLELGLGTGFWKNDYDALGLPLDPPAVRVDRLVEAIAVVKGAFASAASGAPFAFEGKHYRVTGLQLKPPPVQRPHPPLVIGGGGPRMLRLAVREADIVSINNRTSADGGFESGGHSVETFAEAVRVVRRATGFRPPKELSTLMLRVRVADETPLRAAERLIASGRRATALTAEQLAASPKVCVGSVDAVVESLLARREKYGLSYPVIAAEAIDEFAPVVARLAGT